jgi:hypothetical protein
LHWYAEGTQNCCLPACLPAARRHPKAAPVFGSHHFNRSGLDFDGQHTIDRDQQQHQRQASQECVLDL